MMTNIPNLDELIRMALLEDVGDGDHSTLACIPPTATNTAKMVAKADGIVCGMEVGERVFRFVNDSFYHSLIPINITMLKIKHHLIFCQHMVWVPILSKKLHTFISFVKPCPSYFINTFHIINLYMIFTTLLNVDIKS